MKIVRQAVSQVM